MKRTLYLFFMLLLVANIKAQSPESFSYQAVVRDAQNQLITNSDIGVKITILKGAVDGIAVYNELHTVTSNANGLISLAVGAGTTSDDFSTIAWGSDNYYIETALDLTGGANHTLTTTSQLLSVPYALYAKNSGGIKSLEVDARVTNLQYNGYDYYTGQIKIDIENGTPPYKILISNGQDLDVYATTSNQYYEYRLGVEMYFDPHKATEIKIKDASGVVFNDYIVGIDYYEGPLVKIESVESACVGQNNGAINISISGGTPPYSINWSGSEFSSTNEDLNNLESGIYDLDVKDSNGKKGIIKRYNTYDQDYDFSNIYVTVYKPYYTYSTIESTDGTDGVIALTMYDSEPNQPFTYEWSDTYEFTDVIATTKDVNNLAAKDYYLKITNRQGCTSDIQHISLSGHPGPDVTKPFIDIGTPYNGGTIEINGGASFYFNGGFMDDQELDNVVFSLRDNKPVYGGSVEGDVGVDDDPWQPDDYTVTLSGKEDHIDQSIFTNPIQSVWTGDYTLTITCYDKAGNSTAKTITVSIQ